MLIKHPCPLHQYLRIDLTFYLDFRPTDLNIDRDHLLIMDYLPTMIAASGPQSVLDLFVTQGVGEQHDL